MRLALADSDSISIQSDREMRPGSGAGWFWGSLFVATLAACGGDTAVPAAGSAPPRTAVLGTTQTVVDKGILSGTVTDTAGVALGGVNVSIVGVSGSANEQGFFVLEKVGPGVEFEVVIPIRSREALGIRPGEKLDAIEYRGWIELVPVRPMKAARVSLTGIDTDVPGDADRV